MEHEQRTYRGGLVHRRSGNGITSMTITLGPLAKGEKTRVTTNAENTAIEEEVEHCGNVHLYHFLVCTGTSIHVTITTSNRRQEACYTVQETGIEECSKDIWLDIVEARS